MMRYLPHLIALGALLGALYWFHGWAYNQGYASRDAELTAQTARMQARLVDVAEDLSIRTAELEQARMERTNLERQLADEAATDPLGNDPGLGADSLRRLDRIR